MYRVVHPKSDIGVLYQSSVYSETTWSCNMSYERKFCVLSEYVRLQNVRPLIKSIDRSKCESAETCHAKHLITFTERGTNNLRRPRFLASGLKAFDINDMKPHAYNSPISIVLSI